jgi:hypothetical protein
MKRMWLGMLFAALLAGLLVGCSKTEKAPAPTTAQEALPESHDEAPTGDPSPGIPAEELPDLPEIQPPALEEDSPPPAIEGTAPDGADDLILRFQQAVRDRDAEALADCFSVPALQEAVVLTGFQSSFAAMKFQDAVREVFGEEGVIEVMGGVFDPGLEGVLEVSAEELVYNIQGDRGVILSEEGRDTEIVRVDGVWRIELGAVEGFSTDPAEIATMVMISEKMAALYDDLTRQVHAPDMTPAQLKAMMEEGQFAISMDILARQGGMPQ